MIRNVVMGRLPDDATEEQQAQLDAALAGIAGLDLPGQVSMTVGRDLGLRPGGWSFTIVNDWADEEAYRGYDDDPEHNVYRRQIGSVVESIARVQIDLPAR